MVVDTYAYLSQVPETAAVLGWEAGIDEEHLQERRRFFAIWLARTIGMDFGASFGAYLFRAGQYHAAHGPRAVHVPETYVAGSIGMVQAGFAAAIGSEIHDASQVARALGGWSKYLSVQLNQMTLGYRAARVLDDGSVPVRLSIFGRLRQIVGRSEMTLRTPDGAAVGDVLRRFLDYAPQVRDEALERSWQDLPPSRPGGLWSEVVPVYCPKSNWRIMHNGRDVRYYGGMAAPVCANDEIGIFPPGR